MNNSIKHQSLVYTQSNDQIFLFQTIPFGLSTVFCLLAIKYKKRDFQTYQLSVITQFNSTWAIDRTLSGATTAGYGGPGSDGYEWVLRIVQSSSITGASLPDCLVSYL